MTTAVHSNYVLARGQRFRVILKCENERSLTLVALSSGQWPRADNGRRSTRLTRSEDSTTSRKGRGDMQGRGQLGSLKECLCWLLMATMFPDLSLYMYGFAESERGRDGNGSGAADLNRININPPSIRTELPHSASFQLLDHRVCVCVCAGSRL